MPAHGFAAQGRPAAEQRTGISFVLYWTPSFSHCQIPNPFSQFRNSSRTRLFTPSLQEFTRWLPGATQRVLNPHRWIESFTVCAINSDQLSLRIKPGAAPRSRTAAFYSAVAWGSPWPADQPAAHSLAQTAAQLQVQDRLTLALLRTHHAPGVIHFIRAFSEAISTTMRLSRLFSFVRSRSR